MQRFLLPSQLQGTEECPAPPSGVQDTAPVDKKLVADKPRNAFVQMQWRG